ncbi:MAG: hypothetical protein AAGC95_10715 [Pseudomonadota bacterium]
MIYLTRKRVGLFSQDSTSRRAYELYNDYWLSIKPKAPFRIVEIVEGYDFHDGKIISLSLASKEGIHVRYLLGDLQVGYNILQVDYIGADYTDLNTPRILRILRDRRTEIFCSEMVLEDDGKWTHNHLLYPSGSLSITFSDLQFKINAVSAEARDYLEDPIRFS